MKRKIKIIALILIALFIYLLFPFKANQLLYVPKKENFSLLKKELPINSLDLLLIDLFDIQEGWIRVQTNLNRFRFLEALLHAPREKTRTMIMYGGSTIEDFATKIAKQAKLSREKLLQIYKKNALFQESSIIAKHYHIPFNTTEESTMLYMINSSYITLESFAKKYATPLRSSAFREKLIIASIIEKETQNYQEMPLIASVIYNRLEKDMRLQMDATLNYKKNSHTIVTHELIKNNSSLYNSYKHKGLPPQPLASVSVAALKAAFNPAKSSYLYFVKDANGTKHRFSTIYKKHLKKVKKYKTALREKIKLKKRAKSLVETNIPPTPQLSPTPSFTIRGALKQ